MRIYDKFDLIEIKTGLNKMIYEKADEIRFVRLNKSRLKIETTRFYTKEVV